MIFYKYKCLGCKNKYQKITFDKYDGQHCRNCFRKFLISNNEKIISKCRKCYKTCHWSEIWNNDNRRCNSCFEAYLLDYYRKCLVCGNYFNPRYLLKYDNSHCQGCFEKIYIYPDDVENCIYSNNFLHSVNKFNCSKFHPSGLFSQDENLDHLLKYGAIPTTNDYSCAKASNRLKMKPVMDYYQHEFKLISYWSLEDKFFWYIRMGRLNMVIKLLNNDQNLILAKDSYGKNGLYYAVISGQYPIVEVLLCRKSPFCGVYSICYDQNIRELLDRYVIKKAVMVIENRVFEWLYQPNGLKYQKGLEDWNEKVTRFSNKKGVQII